MAMYLTEWIMCPRCRDRVASEKVLKNHRCKRRRLSRVKPRSAPVRNSSGPSRCRRNKSDLLRRFPTKPGESVPDTDDEQGDGSDNETDVSDDDERDDVSDNEIDEPDDDERDVVSDNGADDNLVDDFKVDLNDILTDVALEVTAKETDKEDVDGAETDEEGTQNVNPLIDANVYETEKISLSAQQFDLNPPFDPYRIPVKSEFDLKAEANTGISISPPMVKDLDIIISARKNFNSFMEIWRPYIMPYHLIIVYEDSIAPIEIPEGLDYEIYTKEDVRRILGSKAGCISFEDPACRSFGFLISRKEYVLTVDPDCVVAHDPQGNEINIVEKHMQNLFTPSTPFVFNSLYDPYVAGSDFVSGYPFSLRAGVPTAVSHGLCLNISDRDAPTRLVKPHLRNSRYVDAVVTVPKGTFYPMSGMNLCFNRDLIGPAMYFGLMGEGYPIGRYGDLWAGWCSKVIADHLGFGVKSGLPYVCTNKVEEAILDLPKEAKGIAWQENIIPFFQEVVLPVEATSAVMCYRELAKQVEIKLGPLDEYFRKLAECMVTWIGCWEQFNPTTKAASVAENAKCIL